MTISHLVCHVAHLIDDLLPFLSRPIFFYTHNIIRVRCCCFLLLLLLLFKIEVPWL